MESRTCSSDLHPQNITEAGIKLRTEILERADGSITVIRIRAEVMKLEGEDFCVVRIMFDGLDEPATFFVDMDHVQFSDPFQSDAYVNGTVQAILHGEEQDGMIPVMIPGDAVSYGPYMWVPKSMAV